MGVSELNMKKLEQPGDAKSVPVKENTEPTSKLCGFDVATLKVYVWSAANDSDIRRAIEAMFTGVVVVSATRIGLPM